MLFILRNLIRIIVVTSFLTSMAHANGFLEAVDDFENGRFRDAGRKFLPLANAGDLVAQGYVTWLKSKNETLFKSEEISFEESGSSSYKIYPQTYLKTSIARFIINFQGRIEEGFKDVPRSQKQVLDNLRVSVSGDNGYAWCVVGDLLKTGKKTLKDFTFLPRDIKGPLDCYMRSFLSGDVRAVYRLLEHRSEIAEAKESLEVVSRLGENSSQRDIYVALFNHFKKKSPEVGLNRQLIKQFAYIAAYHGDCDVRVELAQGRAPADADAGEFWMMQAASQGHAMAIAYLARSYDEKNDFKRAFDLYLRASQFQDMDWRVFFNLGVFCEDGRGPMVPRDLERALGFYIKAYERTLPKGKYHITDAELFHNLIGVLLKLEKPEAVEWLKSGVEQRDIWSITNYVAHLFSNDEDGNFEEILKTLTFMEGTYTPEIMDVLEHFIEEDRLGAFPVESAATRAFLKEKKASKTKKEKPVILVKVKNESKPQEKTPRSFYEENPHLSSPELLSFLEERKRHNCSLAFFARGQIYEFAEKNEQAAFEHYVKAAELGFKRGLNNLGVYYMVGGEGIPQDDQKAVLCFKKALECDENGLAHYNYATLLLDNRGGLVFDEAQYVSFLEESDRLGHCDAINMLGVYFIQKRPIFCAPVRLQKHLHFAMEVML